MRRTAWLWAGLAVAVLSVDVKAQVVERQRPEAWSELVFGGRFMDRFLPMPVHGPLTSDTWGADNVKPRYVENGLEDDQWSYWGGNAVLGGDVKHHLFVCRWAESAPKGHMEWPRSHVVHAVADRSTGPYRVKDTLGPGHNPELFELADGRYVVYVIDGYYISDSLNGPWERRAFEFDQRDRPIVEGLSNLTFSRREDGSFLMVCRGGGIWFSRTGISPYHQVTDGSVYPPVDGRFEDPVVWRTNVQYHLIVNDWLGRIAYHLRSPDGIRWKADPGEAYLPGIARYEDGTVVDWFKYERLKVLQDAHGRATQAHFAVIDVLKSSDAGSDDHSSKHICIPLTVGRLLTMLDGEKVTTDTKTIRLRIGAEDGFDPHADVDLASLRFGASEEVDFGRGSRALRAEGDGPDMIVTFAGAGHGLTKDNFAAKLLGETSDGQLLFGYARLPWLSSLESALSPRLPRVTATADGFKIAVEVQNFGQVPSAPADLMVVYQEDGRPVEAATGVVPPLSPFEKTSLELECDPLFAVGKPLEVTVNIHPGARSPVTLIGEIVPAPAP